MTKRSPAHHIIAATFSTDAASISDYRYQATRYTAPAVYNIGDRYFACSPTKPRHAVGGEWQKASDQVFAERAGTVLWFCQDA